MPIRKINAVNKTKTKKFVMIVDEAADFISSKSSLWSVENQNKNNVR